MRTITKAEPDAYVAWRTARNKPTDLPGAPAFTYDDIPETVKVEIRRALYREQGGLDAYTGERLTLDEEGEGRTDADGNVIGRGRSDTFHVEHMWPQTHCTDAEAVDYTNMAGCRPGERDPVKHLPYGARFKDLKPWPPDAERPLFVRPTTPGCEERFAYTRDGLMRPANPADGAAARTIAELNLGGDTKGSNVLAANRAAVFKRVTNNGALPLREARRLLDALERQEQDSLPLRELDGTTLPEFSFVRKFALRRHIRTVEAIRASKSKKS